MSEQSKEYPPSTSIVILKVPAHCDTQGLDHCDTRGLDHSYRKCNLSLESEVTGLMLIRGGVGRLFTRQKLSKGFCHKPIQKQHCPISPNLGLEQPTSGL
uniref:Uncharacterized protein n=1 Tax=Cacopsylla melanoneura TaxID=428564 RepID=A0A8D8Q254_9HEMI